MHQILFLQSVCRLLWLFPPPASRSEPRGEQAQRLKGLQPDLIRWRGVITLKCLKTHRTWLRVHKRRDGELCWFWTNLSLSACLWGEVLWCNNLIRKLGGKEIQEKAASLYNVSENNLEYDLLKVNVFYNSLMEKTVTDKKDYDLKVCIM